MPTFTLSVVDTDGAPVDAQVSAVARTTLAVVAQGATVDGVAVIVSDSDVPLLVTAAARGYTSDTHAVTPVDGEKYMLTMVSATLPHATSPDECAIYGRVINARGDYLKYVRARVAQVSGTVVRPAGDIVLNDDSTSVFEGGVVRLSLRRGCEYMITIVGTDEIVPVDSFRVAVPDRAAAHLHEVLFPFAVHADLTDLPRLSVTLSDDRVLTRTADIQKYVSVVSAHTLADVDGIATLNGAGNVELYRRTVVFNGGDTWSLGTAALLDGPISS